MGAGYEAYYAGVLALRIEIGRQPEYYPPHGRLAQELMTRRKPLLIPSTRRLVYVTDQWKTDPDVLTAKMGDLSAKGFQVVTLEEAPARASSHDQGGLDVFLKAIAEKKQIQEDASSKVSIDATFGSPPEVVLADLLLDFGEPELTGDASLEVPTVDALMAAETIEPPKQQFDEGVPVTQQADEPKRTGRSARTAIPRLARKPRKTAKDPSPAGPPDASLPEPEYSIVAEAATTPPTVDGGRGDLTQLLDEPVIEICQGLDQSVDQPDQAAAEEQAEHKDPEPVLISSAVRTRQTAHLVKRMVWRPGKVSEPAAVAPVAWDPAEELIAPPEAARQELPAVSDATDQNHFETEADKPLETAPAVMVLRRTPVQDGQSDGSDNSDKLGALESSQSVDLKEEMDMWFRLFGHESERTLEPRFSLPTTQYARPNLEVPGRTSLSEVAAPSASEETGHPLPLLGKERDARPLEELSVRALFAGMTYDQDQDCLDEPEGEAGDTPHQDGTGSSLTRAFTDLASITRNLVDRSVFRAGKQKAPEKPSQLAPLRRALQITGESGARSETEDSDQRPSRAIGSH